MDSTHYVNARKFSDILDSANLIQMVDVPTHNKGHTLDLIITYKQTSCETSERDFIKCIDIHPYLPSDHFGITCKIDFTKPPPPTKTIISRKLKGIDFAKFCTDIDSSIHPLPVSAGPEVLCAQYDRVLSEVLDAHAPLKTRTFIDRPYAPWYNDDVRSLKQLVRQYERAWRKSGTEIHLQLLRDTKRTYYDLIRTSKTEYHQQKIKNWSTKQLFQQVDRLISGPKTPILPDHNDIHDLAELFSKFFCDKVSNIRKVLDQENDNSTRDAPEAAGTCPALDEFSCVTIDELTDFIKRSTVKSCTLDPIPASVFKSCISCLLPVLADIINSSLSSGIVPTIFKSAIIVPLIKKSNLDHDELKNYRPVSNLSFASKLLERVVASQLHSYLESNDLYEPMQSAYRPRHNVESALIGKSLQWRSGCTG